MWNRIMKFLKNPFFLLAVGVYYFFFTESGKIMWAKMMLYLKTNWFGKIKTTPLSGNQSNESTTTTTQE